mgnify:CR=1 FL=1
MLCAGEGVATGLLSLCVTTGACGRTATAAPALCSELELKGIAGASTHHTCCLLGPEARAYADASGNPIGTAAEKVRGQ